MMVYWFVFWDRTSLTVAAESLEEAEEELMRRDAPLHQLPPRGVRSGHGRPGQPDLRPRIDQLNAQMDEIDERYDKLTSDENLNKEALTLALSGNMKAMEKIITDYTPKFENAGEALMTYLTKGVTAKKTSLLNTMTKVFDDAGRTMQNQITALSKTTAAKAGNVTVNLSIGSVNQASDYKTVTQKLADAIRSASRGK